MSDADPTATNNVNEPAKPADTSTPNAPSDQLSAAMESEIDQAMADIENAPPPPPAPKKHVPKPAIRGPRVVQAGREHRTGIVVSVGKEDIFVEFGPKELGVTSRTQWTDEELPKVGDALPLVVVRFDPNESIYMCSKPGAVQKADWEMLEPGQIVEAVVTGVVKGGLQLEIAKHRAFMPASRIDVHRVGDLQPFVGEKLKCVVSKVERAGRGNIVLSRRELMQEEHDKKIGELKETLTEGQTVPGTVSRIAEFGAFIDIGGGIDGLCHISDLSHNRVRKTEDVVKAGDTVEVKILKLDWEKGRISLGLKQALPDPFKEAAEGIVVGEVVTGRVTKVLEFGAFIEIATGVEGLVHISELDWKRIEKVESVLKPDQVVKVKVLEVDPDKRRISLSVKQTTEAPAHLKKKKGVQEEARSIEEIRKETPALRRAREAAKSRENEAGGLKSGLGNVEGIGLGDIGTLNIG